ncbi:Uncharacterized protein TCM_036437 [Theobroma cacao]|uniref:RNase H type-1 domain-containing protein n=1 Tax=Theobroma cacao TaxID=3641 RepID=A0A061FRZ7_THECC|nr:Uncharacterized protein TCM_036437 [Theobroma cacao]
MQNSKPFKKELISLFSPWAATHCLEVECDSSNVISWIKDHNKVPWPMKIISNAIESCLRSCTGISFSHILREVNLVADNLTKSGVLRTSNFKAYFDIYKGRTHQDSTALD